MDMFTRLFWLCSLLFIGLSAYLVCCTKRTPIFYAQIASGVGMFLTSKIGRKFVGLELTRRMPRAYPDKSIVIVAYCNTGQRSRAAAEILHGLGYKNARYITTTYGSLM